MSELAEALLSERIGFTLCLEKKDGKIDAWFDQIIFTENDLDYGEKNELSSSTEYLVASRKGMSKHKIELGHGKHLFEGRIWFSDEWRSCSIFIEKQTNLKKVAAEMGKQLKSVTEVMKQANINRKALAEGKVSLDSSKKKKVIEGGSVPISIFSAFNDERSQTSGGKSGDNSFSDDENDQEFRPMVRSKIKVADLYNGDVGQVTCSQNMDTDDDSAGTRHSDVDLPIYSSDREANDEDNIETKLRDPDDDSEESNFFDEDIIHERDASAPKTAAELQPTKMIVESVSSSQVSSQRGFLSVLKNAFSSVVTGLTHIEPTTNTGKSTSRTGPLKLHTAENRSLTKCKIQIKSEPSMERETAVYKADEIVFENGIQKAQKLKSILKKRGSDIQPIREVNELDHKTNSEKPSALKVTTLDEELASYRKNKEAKERLTALNMSLPGEDAAPMKRRNVARRKASEGEYGQSTDKISTGDRSTILLPPEEAPAKKYRSIEKVRVFDKVKGNQFQQKENSNNNGQESRKDFIFEEDRTPSLARHNGHEHGHYNYRELVGEGRNLYSNTKPSQKQQIDVSVRLDHPEQSREIEHPNCPKVPPKGPLSPATAPPKFRTPRQDEFFKTCSECKERKHMLNFTKTQLSKNKLLRVCKDCQAGATALCVSSIHSPEYFSGTRVATAFGLNNNIMQSQVPSEQAPQTPTGSDLQACFQVRHEAQAMEHPTLRPPSDNPQILSALSTCQQVPLQLFMPVTQHFVPAVTASTAICATIEVSNAEKTQIWLDLKKDLEMSFVTPASGEPKLCCNCKCTLDNNFFTKSQLRNPSLSRTCKICVQLNSRVAALVEQKRQAFMLRGA